MADDMLLDRALYKKIKGMDRATMDQTFKNIYEKGYKAALEGNGTVFVDTDALRSDLSLIKGIGDKRLDEIMAVISFHLTQTNKL